MEEDYNPPEEEYIPPEVSKGQRSLEHAAAFKGTLPSCAFKHRCDCSGCPLEGEPRCPVQYSFDYHSYLRHLKDMYLADQKRRREHIDILVNILREHKLPIHWENLALLAIKQNSVLFTPSMVRGLVFFNPDVFVMVREGVFKLKD